MTSKRKPSNRDVTVGVAESGPSAVLVTASSVGELLDRREVRLTEPGLSTHPHHHEGSWAVGRYLDSPWARKVTLAEALALVERVRASAERGARAQLAVLEEELGVRITRIALRACPELPPTPAECIADARAQTYADSVMYRRALALAAEERGARIAWYDEQRVARAAAEALGSAEFEERLRAFGRRVGPPWQARHKLAAAAALAAR